MPGSREGLSEAASERQSVENVALCPGVSQWVVCVQQGRKRHPVTRVPSFLHRQFVDVITHLHPVHQ